MPQPSLLSRRIACLILVAVGLAAAAPTANASVRRAKHRSEFVRVLVKVRQHVRLQLVDRRAAQMGARVVNRLPQLHVQVLRVRRANAGVLLARLRRLHTVRFAERNRVVMTVTAGNEVQAVPSDPLWSQQWGAALTDAPTAWAVTKGSPSVVVAVLDTGVDPTQPDLQGALVPGYDFVNHDSDPNDDFGHGTPVAGVIAARADNGLGGSGYCPRCSIMPVKVAAADGTASELNVASGITWAADHGARVINLSLGGTYGATVASAINYAIGKGAVVVAAAGNNGNSTPFYPAADDGVLSVAATQSNDKLYSWSNFGTWVSVAAPGCGFSTFPGGGYGDFCGTSASTPAVSGLAGLAISFAHDASADAIKQAIVSRAHPVAGTVSGRIDVAATLAALGATFAVVPPSAPPPPNPAPAPAPPSAVDPAVSGLQSSSSAGAKKQIPTARRAGKPRRKQLRFRFRAGRAQRAIALRQVALEGFGRRH